MIFYNASLYPVTGDLIEDGAIVIRDGKIVMTGTSQEVLRLWEGEADEKIDCKSNFLMPGFIEGHGHFSGLGFQLMRLNLLESASWEEVVQNVAAHASTAKKGQWILGRGWHQEKWKSHDGQHIQGYPTHELLSKVAPDNPVLLIHASGHALIANEAAMRRASISNETASPAGGKIIRDHRGHATGVFEENAMDIINRAYEEHESTMPIEEVTSDWYEAIHKAQAHCLKHGITSFQDAGSSFVEVSRYSSLAQHDSLSIRLWVMLRHSPEELKGHLTGFPIVGTGDGKFTCRAVKAYIDGALGSYGAWLQEDYLERPGFRGHNTTSIEEIEETARICMDAGLQLAVHAIGDQANHTVLNIYEEIFRNHPDKKDLRWRIEHAQHLATSDIPRFKELGVIASMQAIHCISDAPFVEKRLGHERARDGAYVWSKLLDAGAVIANGTDTPVEKIDPIENFYASVTRKRIDNGQEFFPAECMTREEALRSYTLSNAYSAFEDHEKGSLEKGKWGDMVLLSQNLLTCPDDSILKTKVLLTVVGGKVLFDGMQ